VMNRRGAAPFVDLRVEDGDTLIVGKLRLRVHETPGHTEDSVCIELEDRVLTGDTLLIGGTGRTDLPTGDAEALHASLFEKLLTLDSKLMVYPAHDYKGRTHSTLATEIAQNPRLQKTERAAFVQLMHSLDLAMPQHLTEALRTNRTGGKTVQQLIAEASRAIAFVSMTEAARQIERAEPSLVVLDVREREQFRSSHLPSARNVPRGELELRANKELRVLPVRKNLDLGRADAARARLHAGRSPRRWLRGLGPERPAHDERGRADVGASRLAPRIRFVEGGGMGWRTDPGGVERQRLHRGTRARVRMGQMSSTLSR